MKLQEHSQSYFNNIKKAIDSIDQNKLTELIKKIQAFINSKKKIFIIGNGGSAAASSHMTCDLGKTIFGQNHGTKKNRLRVISLNDNIPLITAWANDEGYEYLFSGQLRNLGDPGDLLIVITGSGNSLNILRTVETAREIGIESYGLLGFGGGKVKDMLDGHLAVHSDDYGIVESVHVIIIHLITDLLKRINLASSERVPESSLLIMEI